jgi:hypothetical protein
MKRIVEVKPLEHFRIWIRFADGVEGQANLSHLAGKGVFAKWEEPSFFASVRIGDSGELVWDDQIDLCPDSLYLTVTGKSAEEVFNASPIASAHA